MGNIRALVDEYAELTSTPREELRALPWREFRRMAQHIPALRRGRAAVLRRSAGNKARHEFDQLMNKETYRLLDDMIERGRAVAEKLDSWLKENTKRGA